ncbi:hypothetical protein ABS71_18840 [bacterium SCN 62-11]|nr:MAG: hypothetical protein ABS71_18840 [bacterium SCN 62-11]
MNITVKVKASNGRDAILGETILAGVPVTLVVSDTNLGRAKELTGAHSPGDLLATLAYEAHSGRLPMEPLRPHGEAILWVADGAADLAGCKLVSGS